MSFLIHLLLARRALGCSVVVPHRSVFGEGLSLGPNEGDWEVSVDGSRKVVDDWPIHASGSPPPTSGNFWFNVDSGASLPTFRLTGDQLARARPLRPGFSGQFIVEFDSNENNWGSTMLVYTQEDVDLQKFTLPWAARKEGEFTIVQPIPYAAGYWSSVSRQQVYVLEKQQEFGQTLLHVLDLDDGSWFEPIEFDGGFRKIEGDAPYSWTQLKSLDEFGVVETYVPCCLCADIEWVAFNAWGVTATIATDPLNGDAGFDKKGNLLVTDFDSIIVYRAPDYEKEVVAQFSDTQMAEALTNPVKCSVTSGGCPGIAQPDATCGFERTALKFTGFAAKRFAGKGLSACECERACGAGIYWTLKLSSGRCFCYDGLLKEVVHRSGYISSQYTTGLDLKPNLLG